MSLASVVGAISPVIGAALNTILPGGSLLVSALAHLFGVDGTSEQGLAQAISQDPMAAEKLKEFEIAHKYDLETMTVQDRVSARDMNSSTTKATGKTDYMLHFLAFFILAFLVVYVLMGYFIPLNFDKNIMHDLINLAMLPLSFYYGGMYIQARSAGNVELSPPADTKNG